MTQHNVVVSRSPDKGRQSITQVALARVLGYRWPAESDNDMELSEQEARKLIEDVKSI